MTVYSELARVAQDAVRIGTARIRAATPDDVREKGDRDLVTATDEAVEQELSAYLQARTPEMGFLGEERGYRDAGDHDLVWTLDPIDGTSNFAHGLPLCAVSLALLHHREPVVAAIACPFLGLEFTATQGGGAFCNGERIHASTTTNLAESIISIGDYAVGADAAAKNERRLRLTALLAERVERIRMFGSAVLDLAWVATGNTAGTVLMSNKPWDTGAGVLLAREAGARVLDASGQPHRFESAETIAAAPGIADDILNLVQDSAPRT